jgi:predicted nucleic acid-binding Zn finger protein
MDAMVQITSQDVDAVTFSVQQLWNQEGVPMVAVHYRDLTQGGGEDVCNMNAPNQGTNLVQYEDAEEFTAQCTHGYADVGVYVYVGPSDDFNVEECEACSAPDQNYVGYYLTLNCEPCDDDEEQPKPFDCVELSTPMTQEIIGNTNNTIDMGGVTDVPPVTITAQNVDEVTVTFAQVFNPEGLPMMAVGYRAVDSNELQCEMETPNVAFNFQLEITAQCTLGYAEIVLYLYVGDEQDFDVEDCEACTVPNEEQYAAIYYVVPCTPVCRPEVPDCLEGPLVTLADIEHETAVCLYEATPVMINTQQALTTDRVEFTIDNTWPTGSDISSLSVSYLDERSGELQCTRFDYDAANTFSTSKMIVAVCEEGIASVVVEIHSAKIGYHAEQITPNACAAASSSTSTSNNSEIGTCAYEFIVPCGPMIGCGAAGTIPPTTFPTFLTDAPTTMRKYYTP